MSLSKLKSRVKRIFIFQEPASMIDEVLWQNEVYANKFTTIVMCCASAVLVFCMLLTALGIFTENPSAVYTSCIAALIWHLIPCLVCIHFKYSKPWLKHLLMFGLVIGQMRVDCGLGYNVTLAILIPVVFSVRYYSRNLTLNVAILTTIVFAASTYLGALTGFSPVDYNIYLGETAYATKAAYAKDIMLTSFFSKWLMFVLIAGVCAEVAARGRDMVQKQATISQENSRIETELKTASAIQIHSLPVVEDFVKDQQLPFDLATSIVPAKEVGGDFFDYFYVDPTHLALFIADVSGKGVPAALFMMISKLLLDSIGSTGHAPNKILSEVNHLLCEKNINDMFVTVWLGILDLTNGELVTSNAGHENPIICRADGTLEEVVAKHGLVLGGMDGIRYRNETLTLHPGDTLFVYTDGIPEANDPSQKMYGMQRLKDALLSANGKTPKELLDTVTLSVNEFVGDAPQFDDSTMLSLRLNSLLEREGLHVRPTQESIKQIQEYVEQRMEEAEVPLKVMTRINIALDEMYSNVVYHSTASWAEIVCHADAEQVTVIVRDNGIPFDPLARPDPNVNLNADERHVGGLGIYMTKKMMDEFTYQYVDGCNEIRMMLKVH